MDQHELFPDPEYVAPADPVERIPDGRIILLDLNATLSANPELRHTVRPFARFISDVEQYRMWLVDLLRPEQVVLITARHARYEEATLRRIRRLTGWEPQLALFNNTGVDGRHPPEIKRRLLQSEVLPRYGDDPSQYLALESNWRTRQMYAEFGIYARAVNKERPWSKLPQARRLETHPVMR